MTTPVIIIIAVAVILPVNIVLIYFVLKARVRNQDRVKTLLQGLAEQLGLSVLGGEPFMPSVPILRLIRKPLVVEGQYEGHQLRIYHFSHGSGKNSGPTHIRARIKGPNPRGLEFKLYRQGLKSVIGKMIGMQDVETGDKRFDDMFMVKTNDPKFIGDAIIPRIREQLCDIWEAHKVGGYIQLTDDELYYDEVGVIRDEETCQRMLAICKVLSDLRGVVMYYNLDAATDA